MTSHIVPPRAANTNRPASVFWLTAFPLVILALGHMISNMVRTLPAISADVLAGDLAVSAGDIAAMTGFYHLAFAAGQIPVGVALDRFSVKTVVSALLSVVAIGSAFAALIQGPTGFAITQIILGIGCCGMLLCPLTYAARTVSSGQFALWSAVILGVGNSGMVLSASPIAWIIESYGWRLAYGLPAVFALAVLAIVQVAIRPIPPTSETPASVRSEVVEVLKIGASPALRGVVVLAFVSFAIMIGVRGMWGGPWLMEAKDMSRVSAGNVLLALTMMLIAMPMIVGILEKRFGHSNTILTTGHILAGIALILLPAGAQGGFLATISGVDVLPKSFDIALIVAFGALISVQPLLFALGRASVGSQHAGKALSAVNLAFFAGAAAIQAVSAPVNATFGLPGVLTFLGILSVSGGLLFLGLSKRT
ncbi:MFS transporter [Pelagibacterium sp.]|uniref:MFS transporter n=1 Tax=Pelagibacterium sp. TaxID=1967288 RepID=UPI003A8F9762